MSNKIESEFYVEQFIDESVIAKAESLLGGIQYGVATAVEAALKETMSSIRTKSYNAISKRYDISRSGIRENENVHTYLFRRANSITGSVIFAGRKIPLYRFKGTTPEEPETDKSRTIHAFIYGGWKTIYPSVPVKAHQLTGTSSKRLTNAFVAQMDSGHIGIFERYDLSRKGGKITEKMGLSVPQMVGSEAVQKEVVDSAVNDFNDYLNQAIERIVSGVR